MQTITTISPFIDLYRGACRAVGYRIDKLLATDEGRRWCKMASFAGAIDAAIVHAENAYGGQLRIVDQANVVVWENDSGDNRGG